MFSGPGRCVVNGTGEEVDGSPLIAARCRTGFTDLFFNDDDSLVLDALKARMARVEGEHHARYYHLDCNDAVVPMGRAIDQLGRSLLSLAFIDPTNWQMRFDSVARLTEHRKMDLLIVFHSGQMKRRVDVPPRELALFFGDNPADPEWLRKYQDAKRLGKSGTAALLDHYQGRLRELGYAAFDNRVWSKRRTTACGCTRCCSPRSAHAAVTSGRR